MSIESGKKRCGVVRRPACGRLVEAAALFFILGTGPSAALAATIHVPGDQPTIQIAIGVAGDGDEIVVAAGEYNEQINLLGKSITLRSLVRHGAVIDPLAGPDDQFITAIECDSGEMSDTIIDGFVVQGGSSFNGGGLLILNGSPTVRNCLFRNNVAFTVPSLDDCQTPLGGGGAILAINSNSSIETCVFEDNRTVIETLICLGEETAPLRGGGGAINANVSDLTIKYCEFRRNEAFNFAATAGRGAGGALRLFHSTAHIVGCEFIDSQAGEGGGAIHASNVPSGGLTLEDSIFVDNATIEFQTHGHVGDGRGGHLQNLSSSTDGELTVRNCFFSGGISLGGGAIYHRSDLPVLIADSTFVDNTATTTGDGGAVQLRGNDVESAHVERCFFADNSADRGGALWTRGDYLSNEPIPAVVRSCVFSRNTSYGTGGAVSASEGSSYINCTFANNRYVFSTGAGGAMAGNGIFSVDFTATNCIFWGNHGVNPDVPDHFDFSENPHVFFSTIEGGYTGDGSDNIELDPLFIDQDGDDGVLGTVDDNLRLMPDSPAIDAGDPEFSPDPADETDFEGHPRVHCGAVDMGAYEFAQPGDYNCDGLVDGVDFSEWNSCMAGPDALPLDTGCDVFDANSDGDIDLADFAAFQMMFGQ